MVLGFTGWCWVLERRKLLVGGMGRMGRACSRTLLAILILI